MLEILKAIAPLAFPAAVLVICLTILIVFAVVLWGGLDIEAGVGKLFTLKLTKRTKEAALIKDVSLIEPVPELPLLSTATVPALPHEPMPQELGEEDQTKEEAEGHDTEAFFRYLSAKTLHDLDEAFDTIIGGIADESAEFCYTDHLRRRGNLGADHAREAVRELAVQNPTWVMPYAVLLNWTLADHDLVEAKKYLEAGLVRFKSPQFDSLLNSGVRLIFKADGKQAALAFASEWSRAEIAERIRAGAFQTLANLLKEAGDTDGYRVALEFACVLQPAQEERAFSLGYSYAETNNRWAPAIWKNQLCLGTEGDGPIARNNVGIIYSHIDKAVAVQTYEQASREGDKYAAANLAHLLIEDGYVSIAQTLLDSVQDPGAAAENHASARKAALTARRKADDKLKEINDAAKANVESYKASLAAALRNLQRGGAVTLEGIFASADHSVIASADGAKAFCQLRVGNSVFEGVLLNQVTCFAGWLSTKGGSLLTSEVDQFTLLNEGDGVLRLFRWPSTIGLQHGVIVYELRQMQSAPELAPPPPPPASLSLVANALLQKT